MRDLSMREVHMIAYLTMHDWILGEYKDSWSKSGFKVKVNKLITIFGSDHESEFFNLHEAYKAETQGINYLEAWR